MVLNRIMPSRSGYYAYAYQYYYNHSNDEGRRRRSRRGLLARLFGRNGHSPDAEAVQPEPPLAFASVVNPPASQPASPDVLESFVSVGTPAVKEEAVARTDNRSGPRRKKKTGPAALEEAIRDSWKYLSA
jgi:hypothetical protein